MPFSVLPAEGFVPGRATGSARLPQVTLEIMRGQAKRRVRQVDVPVFLIGTAVDCDLVLGDPQFPEAHSYLFLSSEGVWLRHLGHGPAVAVEGRLVKSAQLCHGDHVRTGAYEFRVSIGSPILWSDDGEDEAPAPLGRFALAARRHRSRASAGLAVVQELLDESRGEIDDSRGRRAGVA
jgi:predicted component of type VI protein secretion system